jgi:tol-pal system protein YbgF
MMRYSARQAARIGRAAFFSIAVLTATHASAFFSDDEARRAILEMRAKVEALGVRIAELERQLPQSQLRLLNEVEQQRIEISRLQGQLEEFAQRANKTQGELSAFSQTSAAGDAQQRELVVSLEKRLQQLEAIKFKVDDNEFLVTRREKEEFEKARALMVPGSLDKAAQAFVDFSSQFPASQLLPIALFNRGSVFYATKNYSQARLSRQEFITKFPTHARAPQATLNLAAIYAELENFEAARSTLKDFIANYPKSPLLAEARQRLKELPEPPPVESSETSSPSQTESGPSPIPAPSAPVFKQSGPSKIAPPDTTKVVRRDEGAKVKP